MKSIFVVCDKDGNPFTDINGKDYYRICTGYAKKEEAEQCYLTKGGKVVEFVPKKG